jgi:hypothetical protein
VTNGWELGGLVEERDSWRLSFFLEGDVDVDVDVVDSDLRSCTTGECR